MGPKKDPKSVPEHEVRMRLLPWELEVLMTGLKILIEQLDQEKDWKKARQWWGLWERLEANARGKSEDGYRSVPKRW